MLLRLSPEGLGLRRRIVDYFIIDPENWRESLFTRILGTTAIMGVLVYIPCVYEALRTKALFLAAVDTLSVCVMVGLQLAPGTPSRRRMTIYCLTIYALAMGLLVTVGPISQIFLIGFSILTTLLLGLPAGLYSVVLTGATLWAVGAAGYAEPGMAVSGAKGPQNEWGLIALNFALVDTVITLAIGAVIETLNGALKRGVAARASLERERTVLRTLIDALPDPVFTKDRDGAYVNSNPATLANFGFEREAQLAGKTAFDLFPADIAASRHAEDTAVIGGQSRLNVEEQIVGRDGNPAWYLTIKVPLRQPGGDIVGLIGISRDITDRKRAELRMLRLNRLHSVLSGAAEAIALARDPQDLYERVCRTFVEVGLLRMVFVAELDREAGVARPIASYGAGLDYLGEPTSVIQMRGALSKGTVGTALRTGNFDVCNDIAAAPRMKPWREAALKSGLLASASFPLKRDGETVAVLVLCAGETDYFLDDEVELMATVAKNLSFALDALEKEQQRRQAEARSAQLAAIVESSDDAIFGKDLDGVVTSWNRGAEKIFGYSAEEVVGISDLNLIPEHLLAEEAKTLEIVKTGKSVDNFETVRRAKDGRLITVSMTASPIKNSAGEVIGMSKVAHDVTAAKRSEARFRRLVDSSAQGVFFWNSRGEITGANDAFLSLMLYSQADVEAGRLAWDAMTPPEFAEADRRAREELAATGVASAYEKEFIRKDGSRAPVLLGAAAFEDDPDQGVCFVVDLTERKKLEQQFRQAQKMEGIGTLAGGVAHDFNNILAIVQLAADSVSSEGGLSEAQLESLEDIFSTVQRANALTRQLLLFSSREVFQPQDLELSESIADTTRMLERIVGEHIEMQFKMAPEPLFLHADPGMMDQVLLNLVVNARDAMPDGGHLKIETSAVDFDELAASQSAEARPGAFACLSVSDSGCGIPPENLAKIFEPFFTTKGVGKGTGLGLATIFGIVRQHHGWVNVYSEIGHGTVFRVYLPRLVGRAAAQPTSSEPATLNGGSETILLVEDDPAVRISVQRILSQLGYRVLEAPTGAKALQVWEDNRDEVRLLLTDLLMPDGMTGRDLAERVHAIDPDLKVIYMSGYSADVFGEKFSVEEGGEFLTKPFAAQQLAQAVRSCLDRR